MIPGSFILATFAGGGAASGDTQTVTTGGNGTAGATNRKRGYISGTIGSITDGTSNIYAGAVIDHFYWDENLAAPFIRLQIAGGVANSGWTTVTINGVAFARASGTYSSGSWQWTGAGVGIATTQPFGALSASIPVVFT